MCVWKTMNKMKKLIHPCVETINNSNMENLSPSLTYFGILEASEKLKQPVKILAGAKKFVINNKLQKPVTDLVADNKFKNVITNCIWQ